MSRTPEITTTAAADPAAEQIFYGIMMGDGSALYESYDQLRSTAPVLSTSDGSLVLSRHADCDAALRNPALGKGDEFMRMKVSAVPEETLRTLMERLQRSMLMVNPPEHTRLRRLVSKAFTAGHVEGLRPIVAQRTKTMLAGLAAAPGADFMADFALIQPSHVISGPARRSRVRPAGADPAHPQPQVAGRAHRHAGTGRHRHHGRGGAS